MSLTKRIMDPAANWVRNHSSHNLCIGMGLGTIALGPVTFGTIGLVHDSRVDHKRELLAEESRSIEHELQDVLGDAANAHREMKRFLQDNPLLVRYEDGVPIYSAEILGKMGQYHVVVDNLTALTDSLNSAQDSLEARDAELSHSYFLRD